MSDWYKTKKSTESIATAYESMYEKSTDVDTVSTLFERNYGGDHMAAMKAHKSQMKRHLQSRDEYHGFEMTHEWQTHHEAGMDHHAAAHLHRQAHRAKEAGHKDYKSIADKATKATTELHKDNNFFDD
tara:strand:- start:157 stop:540 length:384 start_codon:yes stop_codon:yes gene_type:complete